jgi:hypothetical protein
MELGDAIIDRRKVEGPVRFASIEYGSETCRLITETLQVPGVPTLQLYCGVHKLWEEHGTKTVKGLKNELNRISSMSMEEIRAYAKEVDDGVLENAIEETMYDVPDFLNEEW